MGYYRSSARLEGWWENILPAIEKTWQMYLQYSGIQSEKNRIELQLQHEAELERIRIAAEKEAAAAVEVIKPPVDWARIAKIGLLVGAVGLGIIFIIKK